MSPEQAGELMRGNVGTAAALRLQRSGGPNFDVKLNRLLINPDVSEIGLVGVGIGQEENSTSLKVVVVVPNSPAQAAGIKEGDVILAINGKSTQGMSPEQAGELMRGNVGTAAALRLQRSGGPNFDVKLNRLSKLNWPEF